LFSNVSDSFGMFRFPFRLKDRLPAGQRTSALGYFTENRGGLSKPSDAIRSLLINQRYPKIIANSETGAEASPFSAEEHASTPEASCSVNGVCVKYIQSLIDKYGVARLPSGIYKIEQSLRMGSVDRIEGVVAADRGHVRLVASGNFPVIQGRGVSPNMLNKMQQQSVVLSGVSLVGGTYGVSWDGRAEGFGPGVTIAGSMFEHIDFLNQSIAGVAAIGMTGLDSNSWRRVRFENLPAAWLGIGKGMDFGMNYSDKQGFIFNTFRNVHDVVWGWVSDRSSGGNFWYRSKFENVGNISRTRSAYNLMWFQSSFNNVNANRGFKILDDGRTETGNFLLVSSRWVGQGPTVVSDTGSGGQAAIFLGSELLQSGSCLVGQDKGTTLFIWNSKVGSPLPDPVTAPHVIINTVFKNKSTAISLRN
jgi:hypothetical protein